MKALALVLAAVALAAVLPSSLYASVGIDLGVRRVAAPSLANAPDFVSAANAYVKGPTAEELAEGYQPLLDIPIDLLSAEVAGGVAVVDIGGPGIAAPMDDAIVDHLIESFDKLANKYGLLSQVLFYGQTSDAVRYPAPTRVMGQAVRAGGNVGLAGTLSGKKITVSPGHGYVNLATYYGTQRPVYCAPLNEEDFHNLEISLYLNEYLEADGAVVYRTRETDLNRGNHPVADKPWWQMAAPFYLYDKGYPAWVYSPNTGTIPTTPGYNNSTDDRRTRPEASNYDATDLYVAIHTNGLSGDCFTGCPTGIEMYRDSTKLGGFVTESYNLANYCQDQIAAAVQAAYSASFPCRNSCNPRDSAFAEIHYPTRPACLLELGFHDSCNTDAVALRDEVFRSAAMWGYYRGICQYFGVSPTWALRSYEIVSYSIPAVVGPGQQFTSTVTLRNRGVAWNEAHQFRLGANGNSDPFTSTTRYQVADLVRPGQSATFTIPMTAPAVDGSYLTDWRMVQDERNAWFGTLVQKNVYVDATGPTAPSFVSDGGPVATSVNLIDASWGASTDARSAVAGYEYRVVTEGGAVVVGWTSAGAETQATIPVDMQKAVQYKVEVRAFDSFGNRGPAASSEGVIIPPDDIPIGLAKTQADGQWVTLANVVVTAAFGDHIYVEEPDRSAAIRVNFYNGETPDQYRTVTGKLSGAGTERALNQVIMFAEDGSQPIAPLIMPGFSAVGSATNPLNPLTYPPSIQGVDTSGLWVQVAGVVRGVTEAGFYLDDGSVPGPTPAESGIWIMEGSLSPTAGDFLTVTGIAGYSAELGKRVIRMPPAE